MIIVEYYLSHPEVHEEWNVNSSVMKKINNVWLSLEEISLNKNLFEILENLEFKLIDLKNENVYLVYSNVVIKKNLNIINIKLDRKNEILNEILKSTPKGKGIGFLKIIQNNKSNNSQQKLS